MGEPSTAVGLPRYLFNHPDYCRLQATDGWVSYRMVLGGKRQALIHFHLADDRAINGYRAPFGGVECRGEVGPADVRALLAQSINDLRKRNIRYAQITLPPHSYQPEENAWLAEALAQEGFHVSARDVSSVLSINGLPYSEQLHPRKRRKLTSLNRQELQFVQDTRPSLDDAYAFIESERKKKKYTLSATLAHLQKSFAQLPTHYFLFGVWWQKNLVGASIAVRVNEHTLYHFLSDHDRKAAEGAVALVLMEGIYQYAQSNGYVRLDLGTSMQAHRVDETLVRFKTELGGVPCERLTFAREI